MLHVLGSFIRELWYFIFAVAVLSHARVTNRSALCQATGFFINFGNGVTGAYLMLEQQFGE